MTRAIRFWMVLFSLPLAGACGVAAGKTSACEGLPSYDKSGLTRQQYLPCAGEMVATLDRLAPQIESMLKGDESARSDARASVRELRGLMKQAGGMKLLERWDDRALTDLNVDIWNTATHHDSCMMVAGQLFGRAPLGDEKMREPAKAECKAYRSPYADASRAYRRLR
jgi:hypothetical protein